MDIKDLPYFYNLSKHEQKGALESLLFTFDEPIKIRDLMKMLASSGEIDYSEDKDQVNLQLEMLNKIGFGEDYLRELINDINNFSEEEDKPFRIVEYGKGFSIVTSKKYGNILSKINKNIVRKKLTNANLETLAIIAYRQPISRPGVDSIRGVNSKEIINSLIDKKYVKIVGKSDAPGRPLLYGTTTEFLKSFGLNDLSSLPKLKELKELIKDDFEEGLEKTIKIEMEGTDELTETNEQK